MTKSETIVLQDDIIDIIHNDMVSSRQYLVRLTGWNNYYDFRASVDDLRNLAYTLLNFIGYKNENQV